MRWNDWVLDLTPGINGGIACFCPYDEDTGEIVVGMNYLSDRCNGNLIGVIHADGQEAVEKWVAENPDWHERFCRKDGRNETK